MKLKHLAVLVNERADSNPRPLLTLDVITSGTGQLTSTPEHGLPSDAGFVDARRGDVLFGKLRPYLAKILLVQRPSFASTELLCLRPSTDVDSRWMTYLMLARTTIAFAVATSEGTKMPRTSWERLRELNVNLPTSVSQRAIADFLDVETAQIDALVEKKIQLVGHLEERYESLADDILWRKPGTSESWSQVPFRRVAARIDVGIAEAATHAYVPEGVPLIRSTNIRPNRIDLSDLLYIDPGFALQQHRKAVRLSRSS